MYFNYILNVIYINIIYIYTHTYAHTHTAKDRNVQTNMCASTIHALGCHSNVQRLPQFLNCALTLSIDLIRDR